MRALRTDETQDVSDPKPPISETTLPYVFAKRFGVVIHERQPTHVVIAYHVMPGIDALTELRRHIGMPLKFQEVSSEVFETLLANTYQGDSSQAMAVAENLQPELLDLEHVLQSLPDSEDLLAQDDDAPIIKLLNALLGEAIKQSASDVHIETFAGNIVIRFRIDGVLREVLKPHRRLAPLIVSRVKVMARLDIAEKRLPQDGRMSLQIAGRTVDVRVSTLPTNHGERVVLRLLDKKAAPLDLQQLGMLPQMLKQFEGLLANPNGIILVTGPTGSGKTTTLYAGLTSLDATRQNILTVEDPIEYDLEGVGQTQVNPKVDMTFARGLRAILRQDPDVVMVGEVRDLETAQIAVQASLTGHLVLSTLHTNSAVGAIARMRDMGIEPFLIAQSLSAVIAQRLVRVLCPHCKEGRLADPETSNRLGVNPLCAVKLFYPTGCDACHHQGYLGRTGIYELCVVDDTLRQMIHDQVSQQDIEAHVRKTSKTLSEDGLKRVLSGVTTLDEVMRVCADGDRL